MASTQLYSFKSEQILFEDQDLVVINKPPGLPTQGTVDPRRDHVYAAVRRFLEARESSAVYLGLHHRLDRDTSGVLLLTKSKRVNKAVAEMFRERKVEKNYFCLCHRPQRFAPLFRVESHLKRIPGKIFRFGSVRSGGDYAMTDFRVEKEWAKVLLLRAAPKTGRTHQIRIHLAENHLPILADPTYGLQTALDRKAPRLMLHAASLTFPHPVSGKIITVESPLPTDFSDLMKTF